MILDWGFQQIDHPPYNSNTVPSDYYLFAYLKKDLHEQCFRKDFRLQEAVLAYFENKHKDDFFRGLGLLTNRYEKYIVVTGNYIET